MHTHSHTQIHTHDAFQLQWNTRSQIAGCLAYLPLIHVTSKHISTKFIPQRNSNEKHTRKEHSYTAQHQNEK